MTNAKQKEIVFNPNNQIPKFRKKMGDIFRSIIFPITVLLVVSIFYGLMELLINMKVSLNPTVISDLQTARLVFKKMMGLIPLLTALSIAITFSSNRTLGGLATLVGWAAFLGVQAMLIQGTSGSYSIWYWQNKTLFSNLNGNELITSIPLGLSTQLNFINSNILIGFLIGYVNALIISALHKRTKNLIGTAIASILLIMFVSGVFGIAHTFIIATIAHYIQTSSASIIGLGANNVNYFVSSLIIGLLTPLNLHHMTQTVYGSGILPYYKLLFAIFLAPAVIAIFIIATKKSNKKFVCAFYLPLIFGSILLGQYEPILLAIFFISPFMYIFFGILPTVLASWIVTFISISPSADSIMNGNIFEYIFNFFVPMVKGDAAYKASWLILVIGLIYGVIVAILTWIYVRFGKVAILGKYNAGRRNVQYEYLTENTYVVFPNNNSIDERRTFRNQVADELLCSTSELLAKSEYGQPILEEMITYAKELRYKKSLATYEGDSTTKTMSLELAKNLSFMKKDGEEETNNFGDVILTDIAKDENNDLGLGDAEVLTDKDKDNLLKKENILIEENFETYTEPDFQVNENNKTPHSDRVLPQTPLQYTTELTPLASTDLNIVESSLAVPKNKEANLSEFEGFYFEKPDTTTKLDVYDDYLEEKTSENKILWDEYTQEEVVEPKASSSQLLDEKEEIVPEPQIKQEDETLNSQEFELNNEQFQKAETSKNESISDDDFEFENVDNESEKQYNEIAASLSFDENKETSKNVDVESFTKPTSKETFTFESKIKQFMILSPLLGGVVKQTENSFTIAPSSGKLIMPNDAKVEFVSENRDKYILNIYSVKLEITLNADFSKQHKQPLHNRIYANQGKQLYKGDFFIDANKKFFSEIGEEMLLTITLLEGDYKAKPIRKIVNSKINKWDGMFDVVLNKTLDTHVRVVQKITE